MLLRLVIFLSIAFLPTSLFAECNFNTSKFIFELSNPKNIKYIEIEIPKSQRYVRNFLQTLSSSFENKIILSKYKKRFFAKINVEYEFGRCEYEGKVRHSGDWPDHIKVKNGNLLRSLDIRLNKGNILNAVKFKLLIPETRNNLNEILGSIILKELGFIVPETFQVYTKVNNTNNLMIFQEKSEKELLERNNRREGPIFEGDEDLLWGYKDFNIFELENVSLSKLLNENWFKKGSNNQIITLKASKKLQVAYLDYIKNHITSKTVLFPNAKKNEIFINYHLLLESMNGHHALRAHNRQYYYNTFLDIFEPIYYDGMFNLTKPIKRFNQDIYLNSQLLEIDKYLDLLKNKKIQKLIKEKYNSRTIDDKSNFLLKSLNQIIANLEHTKNLIISNSEYKVNNFQNNKNRKHFFNNHKNNEFDQFFIHNIKMNNNKYEVEISSLFNDEIFLKNISSSELAEILSENKLENKRTVFLPKNNVSEIFFDKDLELKKMIINDGQAIYSKDLKINLFEHEKTIEIFQNSPNDWILFSNANFEEWKILFKGKIDNNEIPNIENINEHGMTGCVNFYNVFFQNTTLEFKGGRCEDTVNIIKSIGKIQSLKVQSAFSDALDIDFSEINIDKGIIDKAGNDCADFSSGNYYINYFELSNCGDKAISVGEKSILNLFKAEINDSEIGLASKDSSVSEIKNIDLQNVNICLSAYNKKQEFYGGLIKIENISCKDFSKKIDQDKQSNIFINKWN